MGIGELIELLLTFGVLTLIWVVPRLAFRRLRKRDSGANDKQTHPEPPQAGRDDIYDWDEAAAGRWVKRQKSLENGEGDSAAPETAARGAQALKAEEPRETVRVLPADIPEEPVVGGASPREPLRRRRLRRAIIWKEILDTPKALRRDPFGELG